MIIDDLFEVFLSLWNGADVLYVANVANSVSSIFFEMWMDFRIQPSSEGFNPVVVCVE
jgi:hypothetical protein